MQVSILPRVLLRTVNLRNQWHRTCHKPEIHSQCAKLQCSVLSEEKIANIFSTHVQFVDFLEREVRESEERIGSPERELGDGVPLRVDVQVVEFAQTRQRVQLVQTVNVR